MLIIPDKHITLSSADEINQICEPLFNLCQINYFEFFREYQDKSRVVLGTRPDWFNYVYQKTYVAITEFEPDNQECKSGVFLWTGLADKLEKQLSIEFCKKLADAQNQFDIAHGITIIEDYGNYQDYYNFGTMRKNYGIINFYFNNLDILERFIIYFKEKGKHLILEAEKNKFFLCQHDLVSNASYETRPNQVRQQFKRETQLSKLHLSGEFSGKVLTKRQLDCLWYLFQGETAKSASRKLCISHRTFETHIETIKNHFGLPTKHMLLELKRIPELKKYFNIENH